MSFKSELEEVEQDGKVGALNQVSRDPNVGNQFEQWVQFS